MNGCSVQNSLFPPLQSPLLRPHQQPFLMQRVWLSVRRVFQVLLISLKRICHRISPLPSRKCVVHQNSPLYHHFRSESTLHESKTTKRPYFILSIDGGGIRGAVPAAFIEDLERDLGMPIATAFDCIAGTSTGGILTGAYTAPKEGDPTQSRLTAAEISSFYLKHGPTIFTTSYYHEWRTAGGLFGSKYDGNALKTLVTDLIGDTTISKCLCDVLITSYCMLHRKVRLFQSETFSNTTHTLLKQFVNTSDSNTPVHKAVLATAAAPTYFPPIPYEDCNLDEVCTLVDGGLAVNSPALFATLQAQCSDAIDDDRDIVVLSLGTGSHTMESVPFEEAASWGTPQWIEPVIGVFSETNSMMSNIYMQFVAQDPRIHLMRYQVNLTPEQEPINNVNPDNIRSLAKLGHDAYQKALKEDFQTTFIDPVKKWRS